MRLSFSPAGRDRCVGSYLVRYAFCRVDVEPIVIFDCLGARQNVVEEQAERVAGGWVRDCSDCVGEAGLGVSRLERRPVRSDCHAGIVADSISAGSEFKADTKSKPPFIFGSPVPNIGSCRRSSSGRIRDFESGPQPRQTGCDKVSEKDFQFF